MGQACHTVWQVLSQRPDVLQAFKELGVHGPLLGRRVVANVLGGDGQFGMRGGENMRQFMRSVLHRHR